MNLYSGIHITTFCEKDPARCSYFSRYFFSISSLDEIAKWQFARLTMAPLILRRWLYQRTNEQSRKLCRDRNVSFILFLADGPASKDHIQIKKKNDQSTVVAKYLTSISHVKYFLISPVRDWPSCF